MTTIVTLLYRRIPNTYNALLAGAESSTRTGAAVACARMFPVLHSHCLSSRRERNTRKTSIKYRVIRRSFKIKRSELNNGTSRPLHNARCKPHGNQYLQSKQTAKSLARLNSPRQTDDELRGRERLATNKKLCIEIESGTFLFQVKPLNPSTAAPKSNDFDDREFKPNRKIPNRRQHIFNYKKFTVDHNEPVVNSQRSFISGKTRMSFRRPARERTQIVQLSVAKDYMN
ncbi:hypothetical protein EVAR_31292_1 [Eumeta japonica]|uniref:Uncharacterized protein n=1 Tax=Eumeta variegata TaxID=151549 RepID=A0A4C1VS50_EUMVA|nr:hypothetical protein EVAR_31292_1 [Eumeta japonica]